MKHLKKLFAVGMIGGMALGCKNDSTGTGLVDLVGNWHATAIQVTSLANAANTQDLYALGARLTITFNANLTYASSITFPGQAADNSTGTYVQTAGGLTLTGDQASGGDVNVFTYTSSGGHLMVNGGSIDFDFGAGDVPSKLAITLSK